MRPRSSLELVALVCALAVIAAACSGHHASRSSNTSTSTSPRPGGSPPPVPSKGAYLGAWVNPARQTTSGAPRAELDQLGTVQSQVGRLAILHAYSKWDAPAPISGLSSISANGSVPLLDWGCGPSDQISAGDADDTIRNYAEELKNFGKPVFLRYAWEMNLRTPHNQQCLGDSGPEGFVSAWKHIVGIFRDVGASNVAFVWCPATGNKRWQPFYPGSDYVDWIGVDGYVRQPSPAGAATGFSRVFGAFYDEFAGEGRPIMIAETGALPEAQAAYLSSLATVLPQRYPEVKALVYFDAPGPRGNWSLGGEGLRALASLARDPYFSFHA